MAPCGLLTWLHGFVEYFVTKQALVPKLVNYVDRDAGVFKNSRAALWAAGEPLLERTPATRSRSLGR